MDNIHRYYEREEDKITERLENGEISQAKANKEYAELQRDCRDAEREEYERECMFIRDMYDFQKGNI